MVFPFRCAGRLSSRPSPKKALVHRSACAAIEPLERRILFAVQVNTSAFDAPGTAGNPAVGLSNQAETSNVTFSPPGSSANQVVVAYNDGSMAQFGLNASGAPMHASGWSFSSDGGNTFSQPSDYPNPALLPTVSDGTITTGDDANHTLAWNNANGKLYMANTSWPKHSDINVYCSTDSGQTFSNVADATPGAPTGTNNSTTYDKPWLAADNYPGMGYGTVYLAYVQSPETTSPDNPDADTRIAINYLPLNGSWQQPLNSGTLPVFTLPTAGYVVSPQSPEVLVEPNGHVDVVFIGKDPNTEAYGIYLVHSDNPTYSQGWTTAPVLLTTFRTTTYEQYDSLSAFNGSTSKTTIARIPIFPSSAIGINSSNGKTYLYTAWMDGNLTDGSLDGTFGIYTLEYNLSDGTPIGNSSDYGPVAQISGIHDEWMPSLTLSPDGSHAFIGFYGGNGFYYSSSGTYDEQYNAFYITGHITNSTGIDWGTPAQITNLNGSGQPNGGYFDQPGGPSTDEQGANPPESIWNPDYDSASADWQSFHYSFMETSNEQVTNSAGNQVTLEDQEDVYMANVPIPYNGTAPATPYGVTFTPNLADGGTVQWNTAPYQNLSNAYAHIEYSTDTQGWMDLAPSNPPLANAAAGYQAHIPNYSPGTTYYFRVRIQNVPNSQIQLNADASSGYSDPVKSWTGGVPVLDNVLYSLWGYINGRPQYRVTVAWPLGYDASDAVQMQYYDGNRWTTQFPNADGSTTTLGGGSGDTGWAESYIITDSISDPPAFEFSIFFQNSSGGRSAASNVLTAINASNLDVPSAPSINEPTSSDPSNPTNESGDVWVEWNGAPYDQSAIMDVVLTPINESGGGPSVQTYAAYGDADVSGLDSGVEYEIQIRVEKTEQYEGETITLTSDFSSPVYVIGM